MATEEKNNDELIAKISEIDPDIMNMGSADVRQRIQLLHNEIGIMQSSINTIKFTIERNTHQLKENKEKIKLHKQLPYLVANVVELLDMEKEEDADGSALDEDSQRVGKSAVIKTSTRQTVFLPVLGLVPPEDLKPGELVGVNKDSYLVLEKLPVEYDSRVKAMEIDEKPQEDFADIGGCEKQITELLEAVVLPMTAADKFGTFITFSSHLSLPRTHTHISTLHRGHRNLSAQRLSSVRTTRNRKNTLGSCMCKTYKCVVLETRWTSTRTDVHRRRCKTGSRRVRACEGKGQSQ